MFHIEIQNYRYDTQQNEPEEIRYRATGQCRQTRDGLKVEYTEPEITGMENTVTTLSVLENGIVSVNRVGQIHTHMIFEVGKMHACIYDTGYFPVQLCIHTTQMENTLTPEGGCFDVIYTMEIGGKLASRNRLRLTVTPCYAVQNIPS